MVLFMENAKDHSFQKNSVVFGVTFFFFNIHVLIPPIFNMFFWYS